ncbi:MAG: prepilin-type N-terminal cleavage/methylation domain-containing protein [Gemmatimonadetes bacterium]|nr:prepilin-type N-terminal cleavage/methylation domain-containing protein [Gemmatimonadota bacterium]
MTSERGFTIVEVIIAIMVLSVGLLALVGSAAVTTRMISQGQRYTEASTLANQRFEILRSLPCASVVDGSATSGQFSLTWRVSSMANGRASLVQLNVASPTGTGVRNDRFSTVILC